MDINHIRNFSIIAHIDHGKSTLADRILEITGAVSSHDMKDQLLDSMDLERERGITIKLNAVELKYNYEGEEYILHLIDTPGHVDFSYEVSRSLAACEGAILIVDAAQGIEAQTLANLYLAMNNDLTIIPVINKIDLPNADVEKVTDELVNVLGFNRDEILLCSGKTGVGVKELLNAIVKRIPAPKEPIDHETKAMIFDSYFDPYRGVIASVRVFDGKIKKSDTIKMMSTGAMYEVVELGVSTPKTKELSELVSGQVGWINASIKTIDTVKVGDTITTLSHEAKTPLPGYQPMKPMVYSGLFPIEPNKFEPLKEALEKSKGASNVAKATKNQLLSLKEQVEKLVVENQRQKKLTESYKNKLTKIINSKTQLTESVNSSDKVIHSLQNKIQSLNESLEAEKCANKDIVESLKQELTVLKQDSQVKNSQYTKQLKESQKVIKQYKNLAKMAVDKYIDCVSTGLGISASDVKNRLTEPYSFEQIDSVCESLRGYNLNISRLPFQLNNIKQVSMKENLQQRAITNPDDVVDSSILEFI